MKGLKQKIVRNIANIPGWHTKRKIVVIESDDWGSIRMPSKEVYNNLIKLGYKIDNHPFLKYDSLASETDLTNLFEVLNSVKDKNGNPAVITANSIMANPDFKKIRESDFNEYHYEVFTETLERYPEHKNSFNLWKEGINSNVFSPQFHGREHININYWIKALKENQKETRLAFDYNMIGLQTDVNINGDSYNAAFNLSDKNELKIQKTIIADGLNVFKKTFNKTSETFIAPCYVWSKELEPHLKGLGVNSIQGVWHQLIPQANSKTPLKKALHYFGENNEFGQKYLIRNVHFEPTYFPNLDSVDDTLKRISLSFKWNKPAIISSHRINYIGYIDSNNRDHNLVFLKELLKQILKRWNNVEFMSSEKLSELLHD